jgi:hypothetical protein
MTLDEKNAILIQLGSDVLSSEMATDAVWFRQGVAILEADEAFGRSVRHPEIVRGIHASGSFYPIPLDRFRTMRYATKTFQEIGITSPVEVYGCPLEWANRLSKHFNQGRLTVFQVKEILKAMRLYYKSKQVDFARLRTQEGLDQIKTSLDLHRFNP